MERTTKTPHLNHYQTNSNNNNTIKALTRCLNSFIITRPKTCNNLKEHKEAMLEDQKSLKVTK